MMSLSVLTARETVVVLDRLELRIALVVDLGRLHRPSCSRAPSAASAPAAPPRPPATCPAPTASTRERGCSSGIFLKSSGSVGVANVHGPVEARTPRTTGPRRGSRRAGLAQPEDVAVGVLHPEQIARAGHQQIARLALQQDHLGRLRADEHLRHVLRVELLAGQRRLHVLPVVVGRQLREALRAACRRASTAR